MRKAKIYIPNKNPMQSGQGKTDKWILEYETKNPTSNPLMGWESSSDTFTEIRLEFSSKERAINYAKKKKIDFELIEPRKRKVVKKSYADNFLS
ncbi:ETC complex I subunit [Candidatus Pelagibacter sp. HIMB1321]|uniref:ETC complex I subunit n=1 Tax=Candidatus Pelagibacter sp. HIMB1321 TaxID=1388755 RepID=UPI000A080545|nr:ETC complex I subunit [Candidatus Pelagibacter sp. HIMB1321]SMF75468.1 ETC complex I subunit conserved region [Candidatus Pelagibacter sp. HIMB1321]